MTKRHSLRHKVIAWSFVPTAIILGAVALLLLRSYQGVTETLVIERDRELTRLQSELLADDLSQYATLLSQVARGESALNPAIAQRVLQELARPRQQPDVDPALTPREIEVLRLVAQGRSNREIADELVISEVTVRTHVSNILNKLHLASRTQAALWVLRRGVAPLQTPEAAPAARQ